MKFLTEEQYQEAAHQVFEVLQRKIQLALPHARVEHIGSSAVQGAISKGDLDVYVGVSSQLFASSLDCLQRMGLKIKHDTYRSESLCMLECFDFEFDVAVQLVDNSSEHVNFLAFRDALLFAPGLVQQYNQLKLDSRDLTPEVYRERKSNFIQEVLEQGTVSQLNEKEHAFWRWYLESCRTRPRMPMVRAGMPGDATLADSLVSLYLSGKKTAASGLVKDYELAGDRLPQVDEYWIVLDSESQPRCIVKTVAVEFYAFHQVPAAVAAAEGEGDLSLEYWRKAHREFFEPYLRGLGINDLDKELIVVEWFEVVFKQEE